MCDTPLFFLLLKKNIFCKESDNLEIWYFFCFKKESAEAAQQFGEDTSQLIARSNQKELSQICIPTSAAPKWSKLKVKGETTFAQWPTQNATEPKSHLTDSYLQPSAAFKRWTPRYVPHNNKALAMNKSRRKTDSCTASPSAASVHKQLFPPPELDFYFASDYEEYGSAWPVNVTNRKQTVLTAVNNYKHRVECFSTAALRNVHHCPFVLSTNWGEKVYSESGVIRTLEVFESGLYSTLGRSWRL